MSLLAIALVLLSAVVHASWNVAAKFASGSVSGLAFVWTSNLVSVAVLSPFALGLYLDRPTAWPTLLLGVGVSGVIHFSNFITLQSSYKFGDVSIMFPIARAAAPTVSVVGALLIFGERPTPLALCGVFVVVLGIVVIGGLGNGGPLRLKPVLLGLATGGLSGVYMLWDSFGVNALGIDPIVFIWGFCAVSLMLGTVVLVVRGGVPELRAAGRSAGVVGVIAGAGIPLAYAALLFATRIAPTSLVAAGREISIVFVALAGWLVLRESNPLPRIVGSIVVVAGAVLLTFG